MVQPYMHNRLGGGSLIIIARCDAPKDDKATLCSLERYAKEPDDHISASSGVRTGQLGTLSSLSIGLVQTSVTQRYVHQALIADTHPLVHRITRAYHCCARVGIFAMSSPSYQSPSLSSGCLFSLYSGFISGSLSRTQHM